jgi:hypothetical protein
MEYKEFTDVLMDWLHTESNLLNREAKLLEDMAVKYKNAAQQASEEEFFKSRAYAFIATNGLLAQYNEFIQETKGATTANYLEMAKECTSKVYQAIQNMIVATDGPKS